MADNSQKTPFTNSINEFARQTISKAIQSQGRALPCSVVSVQGAIVRVQFEVQSGYTLPQVTIPLFGPEYIRYPIQPGDLGVVFPADAYLGGVSGLGGGVADLTQRGNLTALVFVPCGNKNWTSVDANAVTIYGPNGAVLRDTDSAVTLTLTPGGGIVINLTGGVGVTINNGTVTVVGGDVIADHVSLKNHTHNQAPDSRGDSEQPTMKPNPS